MRRNSIFVGRGAQLCIQGLITVSYTKSASYFSLMAIDGPSITSTGMKPNIDYRTVSQAFIYSLESQTCHTPVFGHRKIVLSSTQRLRKLAPQPFVGDGKLSHRRSERRDHCGVIVDDFHLAHSSVGQSADKFTFFQSTDILLKFPVTNVCQFNGLVVLLLDVDQHMMVRTSVR